MAGNSTSDVLPTLSPRRAASVCHVSQGHFRHWQAFVGVGVGTELVAFAILLAFFKGLRLVLIR
jgi:hypothetical protein